MSIYTSQALDRRIRNVITPKRLQKAWKDGFLAIVYHRKSQKIVYRYRKMENAFKAKNKNSDYGIVFLYDQLNYY